MKKPKIGIRPVIDGRWGGVRESLENQTMNMARAAAELIEKNLFYQDGTHAECVIGCTTIGGGAEAARVAEQFATENVTATLSVTPCWCYGSETMDLDPQTIKAVWGFNGTERPGAVYLAAAMAAHAQRGLPAFSIYGRDVQDGAVLFGVPHFGDDAVNVGFQLRIIPVEILDGHCLNAVTLADGEDIRLNPAREQAAVILPRLHHHREIGKLRRTVINV